VQPNNHVPSQSALFVEGDRCTNTQRSFIMKALNYLTLVLLIVGGLNWGLWGLFEFDLVATIFGGNTAILAKVVYTLVGVSAVVQAINLFAGKSATSSSPAIA
jgi:uncharacterized membrane protein YuzA (DUF378 family)